MPTSNATKLGITANSTVLVLGMGTADALVLIGAVPDGVDIVSHAAVATTVLFFADSLEDVRRDVAAAFAATSQTGRSWVAYRKGAGRGAAAGDSGETPLHRDTLQAALSELDLAGVTLIAIDDTWSAMRIKRVSFG
jgi:hypothetical protein